MRKMLAVFFVALGMLPVMHADDAKGIANSSPAELEIAEARDAIRQKPKQYGGYNLLAAALVRRARETCHPEYYAQAEEAVKASLQLAPNNFETDKISVSILIGKHQYPAALERATLLNKRVPDDISVYGLLADANTELGNYKDAEDAVQWMLDLRPANLPALTRAAHLRAIFGDPEGSVELWNLAYQSTPPTDIEARAWILTQIGHVRFESGNQQTAEAVLTQALALVPNYPYALTSLAQVRMSQKRYADSVTLLQKRIKQAPDPEASYDLAEALRLAGRFSEANAVFADFETKVKGGTSIDDNANRDLIFYYSDHTQPAKALKIAEHEYARRHDVYTLDAYAWALHVNTRDAEARAQIENALTVGIVDAMLFFHAGEIALKSGDAAAAEKYLKHSAELHADGSEQAQMELASVEALLKH